MLALESTTPYFTFDKTRALTQVTTWQKLFPSITPYYAVKCNPCPLLIKTLAENGVNFDCASRGEIETVLQWVTCDRIIYAHPIKAPASIAYAYRKGVRKMTLDSLEEVDKLAGYPGLELIIRLKVEDMEARCPLGSKFGATEEITIDIVRKVLQIPQLILLGFSFHVGSGCTNAMSYYKALGLCRRIAEATGYEPAFIDIGGGFPGDDDPLLSEIANEIKRGCTDFNFINKNIIAEPGRFFATAPFTLYTSIIGSKADCYYLDEGVYGAFNNIIFDHAHPFPASPLAKDGEEQRERIIYGPTCDSIDKLGKWVLPDYPVGTVLIFPNMGAYTIASSSSFNGFTPAPIYEI